MILIKLRYSQSIETFRPGAVEYAIEPVPGKMAGLVGA